MRLAWHATCYRPCMQIASDIRRLLRGGSIEELPAQRMWGAILDGAVDGIEIGAVLTALASRGEKKRSRPSMRAASPPEVAITP